MSSKLLALALAAGPLMFGAAIPVDDGFQEELDQSARTFASSLYNLMNAGRKYNTQAAIAASSVFAGCPGPNCVTAGSIDTDWSNFALQDRQYFPSLSNARYSVSLAAAVVRLLSNEIAASSNWAANTKRNNPTPPQADDQNSSSGSRAAFDIVLNSIAGAQRGGDPRLIPSTSNFDRWMPELTAAGRSGGTRRNASNSSASSGSSGGSSSDEISSGPPSSVPHWLDDDPVEGSVQPTQHLDVVASNPEPGLLVVVALGLAALFLARSLKLRKNM